METSNRGKAEQRAQPDAPEQSCHECACLWKTSQENGADAVDHRSYGLMAGKNGECGGHIFRRNKAGAQIGQHEGEGEQTACAFGTFCEKPRQDGKPGEG